MANDLQQMALADALLLNWDVVLARIGPVDTALAARIADLGKRLAQAATTGEAARVVDDLLDVLRDTPAGPYVRGLVARASLGPTTTTREVGFAGAVKVDLEATIETPQRARESTLSLGTALAQNPAASGAVQSAPVFFATNRNPAPAGDTFFSGDIASGLSYGLATVTIPVGIHQIGKLERPKWWNPLPADERTSFVMKSVEGFDAPKFATRLEAAALRAEAAELLVFLHGFNVTFAEAAWRAAQFAYDSKFRGVVVLFSWPSQGSCLGYAGDEARAGASGEKLAAFLKALEGGPWTKVHCLAHSMGNRVLLGGLADNAPRPALELGQLVFAAADVYVPEFNEKFPKMQRAGRIAATSYASKKDRALWLSSLLHNGPRVGIVEGAPYVVDDLESIDASAVDVGLLGHGYWSGQRALITDLRTLLHQGLRAKERGLDAVGNYWTFPR